MSIPQSLIAVDRLGANNAPIAPILALSKENPRPENSLQKQLQEIFKTKMELEKSAWDECYAAGQLMGLMINGHHLLRKLPYSAGYAPRRLVNEDADSQRAINLTQFYVWVNASKYMRSNPNISVGPGNDSDRAQNAAISAGAVADHYETIFFDSTFSIREALLLLQYGIDPVILRYNPNAKGPRVIQNVMEPQQVQMGEGAGKCFDCENAEVKPASHFTPPGIDGEALGSAGICGDCGSTSVIVQRPQTVTVNAVTGQKEVQLGDFVLEHLPMPACRWDLYKRPEDSSWFIYRQRVPVGDLRLLIGDYQFPEGDQQDKGLDILHALAYAGQAISGRSGQDAGKRDLHRHTVKIEETYLSASDYVGVKIPAGTKTVSGTELPEGKLTDVYPDRLVMVSANDCELLLHLGEERHPDCLTSSTWYTQADSGMGRGMVDTIEVQKRKNATDGSVLTQLLATGTPGLIYDPNVVKPAHAQYLGKPRTQTPANMSALPVGVGLEKAVHQLAPGGIAGQLVDYASKHLDNMFQVTSLVLDFSDYLPIDNRTATGAQIASALANSLIGPQLAGKSAVRKRVIEMLLEQYPKRFPIRRGFPLKGKRDKRAFITLEGADLATDIVCAVIPDSELPVSSFVKQQDFTAWMNSLGGPQGFSWAKNNEPELLQESLNIHHVKLNLQTFDAVEMRCRQRVEQMKQALQSGITDPRVIVAQVKPPISVFESQHSQKMLWWSEWLDDDEAVEQGMEPVRHAAEIMIQTHFQFESWASTNLAAQQGQVQAAAQPDDGTAAQEAFTERQRMAEDRKMKEAEILHKADEAEKDRKNKLEIARTKRPSPKPKAS